MTELFNEREFEQFFKAGTQVNIEFIGYNQAAADILHVQRVDKDLFILSGFASISPMPGTICNIQCGDQNGKYIFKSSLILVQRATDNRVGNFYVMTVPSEIRHIQRRDSFRLKVLLPAEVNYKKFQSLVSCQIVNLSAGGCLLGVNQLFFVGDEIELWFRLPVSNAIEMQDTRRIRGNVVRWVDPETLELQWANYYGISFQQMKHTDEEAIYKYLLEIQRSRVHAI